MKRISKYILILFLLVFCGRLETPQSETPQTPSTITPQLTPTFSSPPSPTSTAALSAPTSTPEVCDPFNVDFCVTNGHFLFQRPVRPPASLAVDTSYLYGTTAKGARDPHHGVEFVNKFGTPVYAAADGVVVFSGADSKALYSPWSNFYGNMVVIRHGNNLHTLYAHLSSTTVQSGQTVITGDKIGEVGQSGVAVGPHLHFEVRRGDVEDYYSTENPELWLVPNHDENGDQFGVMQISVVDEQGHLIHYTDFTAQHFLGNDQPASRIYYGATYSKDMLSGEENAVLGDLTAGDYRIALTYNGQLYERRVEVEWGKLTQVVIVVK